MLSYDHQNHSKWHKWCHVRYTTKFVYDHLTPGPRGGCFSHIWKAKLPYKLKIFTWLVEQGAVLTKSNMVKRKWVGGPTCVFCDQMETVEHLFFLCPVSRCIWGLVGSCFGADNIPASCGQYRQWIMKWLPDGQNAHHFGFAAVCWAIWKHRNKAVFEGKLIKYSSEILIHACSFMSYWAGLYSVEFQGRVLDGVKTLLAYAHRALALQNRAGTSEAPCLF